MEKKMWIAPQMEGMEFMAGEYCESACGEENEVYKFVCDAGPEPDIGFWGKEATGNVWIEDNGVAGLQTSGQGNWWDDDYIAADTDLGGYYKCGVEHEAKTSDAFLNGYYQEYSSGYGPNTNPIQNVIVWRGPNNDNTHCTTNLDMESWTTAKS